MCVGEIILLLFVKICKVICEESSRSEIFKNKEIKHHVFEKSIKYSEFSWHHNAFNALSSGIERLDSSPKKLKPALDLRQFKINFCVRFYWNFAHLIMDLNTNVTHFLLIPVLITIDKPDLIYSWILSSFSRENPTFKPNSFLLHKLIIKHVVEVVVAV